MYPHALLELEITESAIMRNPQIVCAQVLRLKERGFMIAIDDFGSGYSSLGQLQQLMADVLKLDRSFVRRGMFGTREPDCHRQRYPHGRGTGYAGHL